MVRTFVRRLRVDPITFVLCHAVWSMICGLSLALPGDAWSYNPAWSTLQAFQVPDTAWGVLMILDSIALLFAIRSSSMAYRSAVTIVSGIMWFLLGVSIVVTSFMHFNHLSAVGAFSVVGSLFCIIAVGGWVAEGAER